MEFRWTVSALRRLQSEYFRSVYLHRLVGENAADGSAPRNTHGMALLKAQKIDLISAPPQKAWWRDEIIFSGARGQMVALWSQRVSPEAKHLVGVPRNITAGDNGEREPGVAADGSIVFGRIAAALHIWRIPLKSGTRSTAPVTDDPALDGCRACPGTVAGCTLRGRSTESANSWHAIYTPTGSPWFTVRGRTSSGPWSRRDGSRVVFEIRHEMDSSLWLIEQGGKPLKLCGPCSHPTSWFAGKQYVLYTTAGGEIALLDITSGTSRVVLSLSRAWFSAAPTGTPTASIWRSPPANRAATSRPCCLLSRSRHDAFGCLDPTDPGRGRSRSAALVGRWEDGLLLLQTGRL